MRFAQRMERIAGSASFDMLARGRALEAQGRSIVHLGIGEPDFDTPAFIRRAADRALEEGWTHYGPAAGLPELRRAIAESWRARRGIPCGPEHVVVTPGAKPVLFFTMMALLEPGDDVLIPSPAFSAYASIAHFLGARPVPVPLDPEKGFALDLARLRERATERTRLVVLNSPNNPTGSILGPEALDGIATLARERDAVVMSDEIYAGMVYDGVAPSIASLPGMFERSVVVDGFSKTWAMTGWRLGFGIMPDSLARQVTALLQNANSCTTTFVQIAGVAALRGPDEEVRAMVAEFRARRDAVVASLRELPGVHCHVPAGAFYLFPRIDGTGLTSAQLADRLLEETGVVTLPGTAFGAEGEGHLRISYANSRTNLAEGVRRIGAFLAQHARV